MRRSYKGAANRVQLTNVLGGSTDDLTIQTTTMNNWPDGVIGPFFIVIDRDLASEEKILCATKSGNTLTVYDDGVVNGRGADGTSVTSHASGAFVEHVFTATDADQANQHVNTEHLHILTVTSASRPASPVNGQVIYETDTTDYLGWDGTAWVSIGGSSIPVPSAIDLVLTSTGTVEGAYDWAVSVAPESVPDPTRIATVFQSEVNAGGSPAFKYAEGMALTVQATVPLATDGEIGDVVFVSGKSPAPSGAANFTNTPTGTYTGSGGVSYKYITFTGTGNFEIDEAGFVDVVVVGAGAGGGIGLTNANGGGGGGGQVLAVSQAYLPVGTTAVVVGAGGAGGTTQGGIGKSGFPSHFYSYWAMGGGGGGTAGTAFSPAMCGQDGGSGGGGAEYSGQKGVAGTGFVGGDGSTAISAAGAGGGANPTVLGRGVAPNAGNGGAGGQGDTNSYTGVTLDFAGGGGGAGPSTGGAGGLGGGGNGATGTSPGSDGSVNTGGGAGGGRGGNGGNGGSGSVTIRVVV